MPNPYCDNDKAAEYVYYYASRPMLEDTVHRLYHDGVERRNAARAKAEQELYPPIPTARRTQREIDAYLQVRVQGEMLRRQHHRSLLQRELSAAAQREINNNNNNNRNDDDDGNGSDAPRVLTPHELRRHLRKVYSEPLRRREARAREIARLLGRDEDDEAAVRLAAHHARPASSGNNNNKNNKNNNSEDDEVDSVQRALRLRERETRWRPSSAVVRHNDAAGLLVTPWPFDAAHINAALQRNKGKSGSRRFDKAAHEKRLAILSKPQHVTERRRTPERDISAPPPFRVVPKVTHNDL